jgi:hypothetical protein
MVYWTNGGMATAPPRVIDAHSLPHLKLSKAARAVLAADILDGIVRLEHYTVPLVARAVGVSSAYVTVAHRLIPEERERVRKGQRPLRVPAPPLASPIFSSAPTEMDAHARLANIVAELGGVTETLNVLAAMDYCIAA